ncbi:MAG: hypothetical protein ABW224_00710 [Kibdelosporangium sp.]
MRSDLLALTADALAALANRGLVKRAVKELDAGTGPTVTLDADGTVHGLFADGVSSSLPPGVALEATTCSCAAAGMCRHRIAIVLAYQQEHEAPAFTPWSPGEISTEDLTAYFSDRVLTAARRAHQAGYAVTLRRPTPDDPVATAELPSCTVRFLVPGELGHVHTDAAVATRDELTVLAVWAFQEADERGLTGAVVSLDLGGRAESRPMVPASVLELINQLITEGAAHTSAILLSALRAARDDLASSGLHWPAAAVHDLVDQLDAYHARSARYEASRVSELITEIHARARATGAPSQVLGGDEPRDTALRRVRLTALGCRVRGTVEDRTAEVFLAGDGIVLVMRHRWETADTGHALASRRMAGTTLGRLAASNLVSESATRTASRAIKLSSGRVAKTTVTPVGNAWADLPESVIVRNLATAAKALADLPPRLIRARVEAEHVRVVQVAEVTDIAYHPGAQRLTALIADHAGGSATLSATHRGTSPGALDALASSLRDNPAFISGSLRRVRGTLVIDPIAVLTPSGLVVPDLAPTQDSSPPLGLADSITTPIMSAVDTALAAFAESAHRGLTHMSPSLLTRLTTASESLRRVGLRSTATHVTTFATNPTPETWFAAHLRLITVAEFH